MKQFEKCILFFILVMVIASSCDKKDKTLNVLNDDDFRILPSGIMVDTRISEAITDVIVRRFEAIENGDIAAFRSTLPEMQDGADFYHQMGFIFRHFEDFFGISADDFNYAIREATEDLKTIADMVFHGEFPLKSRNTGTSIERIEFSADDRIRIVTKNGNEEEVHYFTHW